MEVTDKLELPLKIELTPCELSCEKNFETKYSFIELREDSFIYRRWWFSDCTDTLDMWQRKETNVRYRFKRHVLDSVGYTKMNDNDPGDVYKIVISLQEGSCVIFYVNGRSDAIRISNILEKYIFVP